jgi:hypothetical protein
MSVSIKKKIFGIKNYESNVFNESNEEVNYFGTNNKEKSDVVRLDSNNRILISYKISPSINEEKTTVSLNSTKNKDIYCDQDLRTVNVKKILEPSKAFGIKNYIPQNEAFEDKASFSEDSDISMMLITPNNSIENTYPIVVDINAYDVLQKGSYLDPLDLYKEITRDVITEYSLKGIKANGGHTGLLDLRKRNISLADNIQKNNNTIEPYDDQGEANDLGAYFKETKYYQGNVIKASLVNNQYSLLIDESKSRYKSTSSKESRYLSEEENKIEPFRDTSASFIDNDSNDIRENRFYIRSAELETFFKNKDINIQKIIYNERNNCRYCSRGFFQNYSYNNGIETIAFRGKTR